MIIFKGDGCEIEFGYSQRAMITTVKDGMFVEIMLAEAPKSVRQFLTEHPEYPYREVRACERMRPIVVALAAAVDKAKRAT